MKPISQSIQYLKMKLRKKINVKNKKQNLSQHG
jgi:hypothetical protein